MLRLQLKFENLFFSFYNTCSIFKLERQTTCSPCQVMLRLADLYLESLNKIFKKSTVSQRDDRFSQHALKEGLQ